MESCEGDALRDEITVMINNPEWSSIPWEKVLAGD
tara:strand:- start:607 stop:711 length:105 start_codon:yes stop_codon:yes gene_type:complete